MKPSVSVAVPVPLPPSATLETDNPLTLGFVTSWKLAALTPLPKAWSLPSVTVSSAPSRLDSSSGVALDATVTAVYVVAAVRTAVGQGVSAPRPARTST